MLFFAIADLIAVLFFIFRIFELMQLRNQVIARLLCDHQYFDLINLTLLNNFDPENSPLVPLLPLCLNYSITTIFCLLYSSKYEQAIFNWAASNSDGNLFFFILFWICYWPVWLKLAVSLMSWESWGRIIPLIGDI